MMEAIKAIQAKLEQHDKTLGCIQKSVQRMETALLGDEPAGVEGVIKRVNRHGRYIDSSKRRLTYAAGFGAGVLALWEWMKKYI